MAKLRRRGALVALYAVVASVLLGVGTVAAQDGGQVEVSPGTDFSESLRVEVNLTGLNEFDGGTAAVYQCGNADADGNPITPTPDDCFAPGGDGYVFGPIVDASFSGSYTLQLRDIGVNRSRCVLPDDGGISCQMVVATTMDGSAKITGVPLDGLLVQLATEGAVEDGQLPVKPDGDAEVLGSSVQS